MINVSSFSNSFPYTLFQVLSKYFLRRILKHLFNNVTIYIFDKKVTVPTPLQDFHTLISIQPSSLSVKLSLYNLVQNLFILFQFTPSDPGLSTELVAPAIYTYIRQKSTTPYQCIIFHSSILVYQSILHRSCFLYHTAKLDRAGKLHINFPAKNIGNGHPFDCSR